MLTQSVKLVRLAFLITAVSLSGCSMLSPKPEIVDTQAEVLGPIPAELQASYEEALILLRDKEYVVAEEKLIAITTKFPTYAGPWSNLAIAQSRQEKFEQALLNIDASLMQDPKFCQALSLKGVILRELGRFKLAKEQYIAALACDPTDALTLYNLGVLSDLYLHDNVAALSYYQQYLVTQGEQQDETVQSWVVDLKRRVPAEVKEQPSQNIENSVEGNTSEPQLAGEE